MAAIAGLANRYSPELYILREMTTDEAWLSYLQSPGGWLANTTVTVLPTGVEHLVAAFGPVLKGVVLWGATFKDFSPHNHKPRSPTPIFVPYLPDTTQLCRQHPT